MNLRPVVLAGLVAFGCAPGEGLDLGLPGCTPEDAAPPFPRSALNTVERGAQVVLTAGAIDVLLAERERLAGLLLDVDPDGWVRFELPALETGDDRLGLGLRDMVVGFDLRTANIGIEFIDAPPRIRLRLDQVRLRLESGEVWIGVGGNGGCRLENGVFAGSPEAHFIELNLQVDVQPAVDAEGRLSLEVGVAAPMIDRLDIELGFDPNLPECTDFGSALECEIACGASDLGADIVELLFSFFSDQIAGLLTPFIQATVDSAIGQLTEKPIAFEGAVAPELLAMLLPLPLDAHDLLYRLAPAPEGFTLRTAGERGDGLGLTLDVGLDAIDHPCVAATERVPVFPVGPAPALTGFDEAGEVYAIGLATPAATINRALWTLYRSGLLCASLDSDAIEELAGQRIDTGALGVLLPGLERLAGGPRPILIAIDPRMVAEDFPLARLRPVMDDGGIPQVGIDLTVPGVGLDVYVFLEDRWTRAFGARVDVGAGVVVQATPDNQLALALDPPEIGGLEVTYDALTAADDIPRLLELVLDLATRTLVTDALTFDVGLDGLIEQLVGLPFDARIVGLRVDGPMADHLSVLTTLERSEGAALVGSADTLAAVHRIKPGRVELDVEAAGVAAARFQVRLDDGPWRPLQAAPDGRLAIESSLLWVPGDHRVDVRAVGLGAYRTLDPTPARVEFVVPRPTRSTPTAQRPAAPEPPPAGTVSAASGCAQAPGASTSSFGAALLATLCLVTTRRRRDG